MAAEIPRNVVRHAMTDARTPVRATMTDERVPVRHVIAPSIPQGDFAEEDFAPEDFDTTP